MSRYRNSGTTEDFGRAEKAETDRNTSITSSYKAMARRRRTYKFTWRSKKANHGRTSGRGKDKSWGKKH